MEGRLVCTKPSPLAGTPLEHPFEGPKHPPVGGAYAMVDGDS